MSSWKLCNYIIDETTGKLYYISTVPLSIPEDSPEGIGIYTHETLIATISSVKLVNHTSQDAAESYHKDILEKIKLGQIQFDSED